MPVKKFIETGLCPNKNTVEWVNAVTQYGEARAYVEWYNLVSGRPSLLYQNSKEEQAAFMVPLRDSEGNVEGFFPTELQSQAVDSVFNFIVKGNQEKEKKTDLLSALAGKDFNELLAQAKADFAVLARGEFTETQRASYQNPEVVQINNQRLINSWDDIIPYVVKKFKDYGVVLTKNNTLDDNGDNESEVKYWEDSIEIDQRDTLSGRIKLFLASFPELYYNKTVNKVQSKINPFGTPYLYGFDRLYLELGYEFMNDPTVTVEEIIERLTSDFNKKNKPIFYAVGSKLRKADVRIKNEFATAVRKRNIPSYLIQYKGNEFTLFEENRATLHKSILDRWKENQFKGTALFKIGANGQLGIDSKVVADFRKRFNEIETNENETKEKLAYDFTNALGINLSEAVWQELYTGLQGRKDISKFRFPFENQFGFNEAGQATGLFSTMLITLEGGNKFENEPSVDNEQEEDEVTLDLVKNNPVLIQDTDIRILSQLEARYSPDVTTKTHITAEGKQTYDFSNSSYEFNQLFKLKRDEQTRKEYENDLFASNAPFFDIIFRDPTTRENYTISTFSAMKGKKNRSKAKTSATLSEREMFVARFHAFHNKGAETASYFDLTKSDKTIVPLHAKVPKINVGSPDSISADVKAYFRMIVQAEIERIDLANLDAKPAKSDVLFYFNHLLNYDIAKNILKDVSDLWENPTLLAKDSRKREIAIEILNEEFIKTLYENTLKRVKETDISPRQLGGTIDGQNQRLFEYSINQYLFNASLSMMFSGDPASFYKEGSDIYQTLIKTYNNYSKRQAKDVAPGSSSPAQKPTYTALVASVPKVDLGYLSSIFPQYNSVDTTDAIQLSSLSYYVQRLYEQGGLPKDCGDISVVLV